MLTLLPLLLACQAASPPPSPVWDGAVTRVLGDGSKCTIVAIHGYGATPESLAGLYEGLSLDAVVVLPRAPLPMGDGWAWFMSRRGAEWSDYVEAIGIASARLAEGLEAGVPGARSPKKPIVTGFSQGGMLSWGITATHPSAVSAALPIGGLLPEAHWPSHTGAVPIDVFHGDVDRVVSFQDDARAAKALKDRGWPVVFHPYAGVGHSISQKMREDYARILQTRCR